MYALRLASSIRLMWRSALGFLASGSEIDRRGAFYCVKFDAGSLAGKRTGHRFLFIASPLNAA